jgi:DUF4097 and DUF4098 domain-containing protein YvlB
MSEDNFEQVFQVSQPARLDVSNIRGSTQIHSGAEGVITVKAVKHEDTGDSKNTEIEIAQEGDGTVKVKTRFPEIHWGWLTGSQPCKVDYVITAPRACTLKVNGVSNDTLVEGFDGDTSFNSVSGDMTLKTMNGNVRVNTVSGDLDLSGLTGELRLNTVSGDIRGKSLTGPVHLDTVSGDIEFDEANLPSVQATTVSGDLLFKTALGEGPYKFNSVSGEVELKIPAETHCSAELNSVSGSLSVNLPATSISRQRGRQAVEIQGGGVKVSLSSVSGDLALVS